jgi:AraC-like DNA-binding protein
VIFANDDWVFGAVVLFILFIGFFGIRQVGIFNPTISPTFKDTAENTIPVSELETVAVDKVADRPKYMRSGLTTDQAEMLHRSLNLLMREQKVFREGELSLAELANRLNTLPNYLSQVINEREGKNFYDYINTIRIEEFKRLAVSPDSRKYTLLALAQECGFNSKSSFNRYFKKVAGMSPSEYLDQSAQIAN